MQETEILGYAQRLFDAHGDKAEFEAAQKERECEEKGDTEGAADWAKIRLAIHEMRG